MVKQSREEIVKFINRVELSIGKLRDDSAMKCKGKKMGDLEYLLNSNSERYYAGYCEALADIRKELLQE